MDSRTGIQVMGAAGKDVAKDRLVVMVTHNPELAEQYANRIVRLRDALLRRYPPLRAGRHKACPSHP